MTIDQQEFDNVNNHSQPALTPQQERALRYLERKCRRTERLKRREGEPLGGARSATTDIPPTALSQRSVVRGTARQLIVNRPLLSIESTAISPQRAIMIRQAELEARRWQCHRQVLQRYLVRKHLRQTRLTGGRRSNRFWLAVSITLISICLLFFSVAGSGTYLAYSFYLDTQEQFGAQVGGLRALLPRDNLKMYDSKGVMIGQLTDQGIHTTVALADISHYMQDAAVSTEDKNFWTNPGVDLLRTAQSALDDLRNGHIVEGGSTITQQLIKKLVVGDEVSMKRKLQEIMLTPMINDQYSKADILGMYLNTVYFGEQAYGVDAAASVYFGLQDKQGAPAPRQLDLAQSAMLAGLLNSPYSNDPLQNPQGAFQRLQIVLERMIEDGYIQRVDALDALKEAQSHDFFKPSLKQANRAPHFFNFVLTQLEAQYRLSPAQLSRSGLIVYTTLNVALQDKIQKIAQDHIAALRDINHATNAAEVLIDFHTGAVLSLLGSIDYNDTSIDGQFDVATQGYRQPGSSFKPYVYVTAFEQGVSPAQAIDDTSLTIDLPGSDPSTFSPTNYDLRYHGHMTLRCALQNSLNIPAVKVLQHVGIDNAVNMARAMGVTDTKGYAGYSLVLGGLSIHLIDHTSAYGTFADGGVHVPYYTIEKVIDTTNHRVYAHSPDSGTQVISPQLAYMMTNVLSDNASRTPEFYDCNLLQLYANSQYSCWAGNRGSIRPAAAKTGTTTDFRDNWTVGYTTDFVMGVWAGNNNNTPMINVTGVQGAAPIWHDAMLAAEQGHPIHDFVNPGGLEQATVTYPDGVKTTDWFLPGTMPTFTEVAPTTTLDQGNQQSQNDLITQNKHHNQSDQPGLQDQPMAQPYCPSSYSFVSNPPSNNVSSPIPGWW